MKFTNVFSVLATMIAAYPEWFEDVVGMQYLDGRIDVNIPVPGTNLDVEMGFWADRVGVCEVLFSTADPDFPDKLSEQLKQCSAHLCAECEHSNLRNL